MVDRVVSSVSSSKALIPLEEEAAWVADALGPPSGEGGSYSYTSAMRTPKRNEELVVAGGDVHVSRQTCRETRVSKDTKGQRTVHRAHNAAFLEYAEAQGATTWLAAVRDVTVGTHRPPAPGIWQVVRTNKVMCG